MAIATTSAKRNFRLSRTTSAFQLTRYLEAHGIKTLEYIERDDDDDAEIKITPLVYVVIGDGRAVVKTMFDKRRGIVLPFSAPRFEAGAILRDVRNALELN